jgi:protein phosphatase
MGQAWVVALIAAGVIVALFIFFRNRGALAPPGLPRETKPPQAGKAPANASKPPAAGSQPPANASKPPVASSKPPETGTASVPPPVSEKAKPPETEKPAFRRAATVPEPAVKRKAPSMQVEKLHEEDEDDDITIVTLTPRLDLLAAAGILPDASEKDEDDDDGAPPDSDRPAAVPIIYDEDAAEDEPTRVHAVILVSAVGQTDLGQKRKINEDRYLVLDDHQLYVVADGMGGHAGGEVASQCAVDTIAEAFNTQRFEGTPYPDVPRRGGELALAIQMANHAIYEKAKREPKLAGMGTTIVSARFTPGKERVYIGHVGDSRCYRFRSGQLTQVTTDHTMGAIGMTGPFADHLSRAVGIAPAVKVDLVIAKPRHDDVFLLCSDGLSKMVKDEAIREVLASHPDPNEAVKALVQRANAGGGRDNITVILVVVKDPTGFAKYLIAQEARKRKAEAEAATAAEHAPVEEATTTAESPVMPGGDPKPGAPAPPVRPVEVEEGPAISVKPMSRDSALGRALEPESSDTEIMHALEPLTSESGAFRTSAAKASESGTVRAADASAAASQELKAVRPSVPPRPSTPSVPPPRPSMPEARKSVADAKPATPVPPPAPDARKSVTDAKPPSANNPKKS